jgi:hypothetical protein
VGHRVPYSETSIVWLEQISLELYKDTMHVNMDGLRIFAGVGSPLNKHMTLPASCPVISIYPLPETVIVVLEIDARVGLIDATSYRRNVLTRSFETYVTIP